MTGSLEWLAKFHHVFVLVAEFLAISTNSIVISLVATERKRLYTDYQRALILNCVVDYICSFLALILQPHYEILEGQWIFILSTPLSYLPKRAQMLAVGSYSFINCFGIATIPIQFYYRKCLICDDEKISNRTLFLFTSVCASVSLLFVFVFAECYFVSDGVKFEKQALLDSGLASRSSSLLNAEMSTPPMLILTVFIFIMIHLVYGSIFIWSRQVYRKLNEITYEMSPNTRRLQSHFNRMLAAQICLILLFGGIPGSFMFFLMTSRINLLGAGTIISILFVCVPLINPFCTLFLVGQFRQRFFTIVQTAPMSFSKKTSVEVIGNTPV